jgi:hypothetical protein
MQHLKQFTVQLGIQVGNDVQHFLEPVTATREQLLAHLVQHFHKPSLHDMRLPDGKHVISSILLQPETLTACDLPQQKILRYVDDRDWPLDDISTVEELQAKVCSMLDDSGLPETLRIVFQLDDGTYYQVEPTIMLTRMSTEEVVEYLGLPPEQTAVCEGDADE